MPLSYSPITDNSLLPFAQPGAYMVPFGDDNYGEWFSILNIFENGLQLGDLNLNGLRVNTNGEINFSSGPGYTGTFISALQTDQDSRVQPAGVVNPGIWIEENAARDSIVVTWNGIGQYWQNINTPSFYQVEIIDRGAGDAEIIYRFQDLSAPRSAWGYIQTQSATGNYNYFYPDLGNWSYSIPMSQWDEIKGNTGIPGVWQVRVEGGVIQGGDLHFPIENLQGSTGDDSLTGGPGGDILRGFEGNDTLIGDIGNDSITGDLGDDFIAGDGGDDYITGADGNDSITGGLGNDLIGAGLGNDTVDGGDGNDELHGGEGDNHLLGGSGSDRISAGGGHDSILGGQSSDTINAGDGNDTISGGGGYDTIHAGEGDNLILGDDGSDYLTAGAGNDTINGGGWDDSILAGEGDDIVEAWWGSDTVYGGLGNDRIVDSSDIANAYLRGNQFYGMDGADTLTGGNHSDTILGGDGDDEIRGRDGSDLLAGGAGNDRILGDDGNLYGATYSGNTRSDTIFGGDGDDWIFGGSGADSIDGNIGNDTLLGGDGNDQINGGVGDDFIFGGLGYDRLTGGPGADRFFISSFRGDVSTITDYDASEGDWLVMPGDQFDPADLRLVGDRMYNLDGTVAEYVNVQLVRIGPSGGIAQTLFEFDNPSQLDQLILRFPLEGDAGQVMVLDLF